MTTATATTYAAIGSVRGSCGHRHKSITAAVACQQRDSRSCRSIGGYTDRVVRHADGTTLSEAERETAEHEAARLLGWTV